MAALLLTAAAGLVGRCILNELQQRGHSVIARAQPNWQARIEIESGVTRIIATKDLFLECFGRC